jgi:hypothetical protein
MAKASRADWAKRVERWKDSGLTAKEFAAETGLNVSTLSYWKWRLGAEQRGDRQADKPRTKKSRPARRAPKARSQAPTFVEVTAPTPVAEPLELVMPGELRVRVPVGFDEATLAAVLRVTGARP